jgi:DNA-binding ferritin-like protein
MSDDTQKIETAPEAPETQEVTLSPIEQKALEMGWRPKEEFDGSEEDFIDAKEFVRRKPLFEKIEHQSKQLKEVTKALEAFKQHYGKVQETEYNRALADLKREMKQANREGDFDRADIIERQIERVETEAEQLRTERESIQVSEQQEVDPRFKAWTERNPWYTSQRHMRTFADEVGNRFLAQGLSPLEVLKEVEKAVRKEFPTKFQNPNKANAPAVEGSSAKGTSVKNESFELNDMERQIMNTLVRGGHITKEKYIADLKKQKERT